MNLAHVHLILNHIPVIGIPIALLFLGYGLSKKNDGTQRIALFILVGLAAVALTVYFTGEPAEELVENLPGVAESFIEAHEDAALFSLILTLIVGASALVAIWFQGDSKKSRLLNFSVFGIACLAAISLFYTANLGGKVRHTELRTGGAALATDSMDTTDKKDNDDK